MDRIERSSTLAGKRILVIEDEGILAVQLIADLEAVGALPIETKPDIAHSLAAIDSGDPIDAAILNVWLSGQLAFPVADALLKRGIPFVFVTGSQAMAIQRYPDITAHPKPADMDAVIRNLAKLIAMRAR